MIVCGNVGFIHIPRTAGTSIRNALASQGRPLYSVGVLGQPHADLSEPGNKYNNHHPLSKFDGLMLARILSIVSGVRNPWDRYVSWYEYHVKETGSDRTFGEFMATLFEDAPTSRSRYAERNPITQSEYIFGVDPVAYEYTLLRFENLAEEWSEFCEHNGLNGDTLPVMNRTDRDDYARYYQGECSRWIDVVADQESHLIEQFRYEFGE